MMNILIGTILFFCGWRFGIKPPMFLTEGDIRIELVCAICGSVVMFCGFCIIYSSL